MARYGPEECEVVVLTLKDGVLSPIAHDLKLRVERFEIQVDEAARSVRAEFDPASLRVVCAMQEGREAHGPLSEKDRAQIEVNLRDEVLEVERFPKIRFASKEVTDAAVIGTLALHGRERELKATWWTDEDGRRLAEARLDQRHFSIRPYRALFGALKVQPRVTVRVRIPARSS